MISFCTATSDDLPEVLALLEVAQLPLAGVKEHLQNFILALDSDRIIGCAGLEIHEDAGLLRSVAVDEAYRLHGLGEKLTRGILELAQHQGLSSLSLLTTTAQNYFPRFGFVPIEPSQLPRSLNDSEELSGACPDTAVGMTLRL
ncbi:MAG: GNAT family N-acetyltransferase [Thermaceae bacterium]|nr:GNAT family N-acetyltransferase [Thermaceae bacterium]